MILEKAIKEAYDAGLIGKVPRLPARLLIALLRLASARLAPARPS